MTYGLGLNYQDTVAKIHPEALVGYYPLNEYSGSTAYDLSIQGNNGTHTAVTPANALSWRGMMAPYFDGSTSYTNLYAAAFIADASTTEGSVSLWCRLTSTGLGNTTAYYAFKMGADANNAYNIFKSTTANTFTASYVAGGTTVSVSPTLYLDGTYNEPWVHIGMTVSVTGDALKVYVNGAQSGTTQSSLGTWSGALAATLCTIGAAATTPTTPWLGWIADVAVWNIALSDNDMAVLGKVAG